MRTLVHPIIISILLAACLSVRAQVQIPDTNMQNWLNNAIPGIVDAAGVMDTLHPGIVNLDSLVIGVISVNGITGQVYTLNTFGIDFLDSLTYLRIIPHTIFGVNTPDTIDVVVPSLPSALTEIQFGCSYPGSISLPVLPRTLRSINVMGNSQGAGRSLSVAIAGMPDTLQYAKFSSISHLTWPMSNPHIEELRLEVLVSNTGQIFECPKVHAEDVTCAIPFPISGPWYSLDLTNMITNNLSLYAPLHEIIGFPDSASSIYLENQITIPILPPLPPNLNELVFSIAGPSADYCLPPLPTQLVNLSSGNKFSCIPNYPSTLTFYGGPVDLNFNPIFCSVLNSSCPGAYPGISGHAYIDQNQSGTFDAGEPAMYQVNIGTQPITYLVSSDADGYWEMGVYPGNYTIAPTTSYPYAQSFSPAQHTAVLPNLGDADTLNDFGFSLLPNVQDLQVRMHASAARPGFDHRLHLMYKNYGTVAVTADLSLDFDADQSWVGSSVVPTTMTGNLVSWNLPNLQIGESGMITVDLHTDITVALGTAILHDVVLDPLATDTTPSDNVIMWSDTVIGSYDPNDKLLSPATLAPADVQAGNTPIEYTIRFQNTGTYQAERVVVLDTLSTDLQWNSFDFIGSSHSCNWYMFDGVLHFIFDPIILPDSTSDEPNSHGFVKFSILPSDQLQNGETVENIAHIVFDFNEPIVTPPAVFTVDVLASIAEYSNSDFVLYPNPARDRLMISLDGNWSSQAQLTLRDALGRTILTKTLVAQDVIELDQIPTGTYLITISSDRRVSSKRFVKR